MFVPIKATQTNLTNHERLLFSFWKPVIMPIYTEKEPNKYARRIQVNASISLIEPHICVYPYDDDDEDAVCIVERLYDIRVFFFCSFRIDLLGATTSFHSSA